MIDWHKIIPVVVGVRVLVDEDEANENTHGEHSVICAVVFGQLLNIEHLDDLSQRSTICSIAWRRDDR